MGKIVATEFMALDGVMEEPVWTVPFWNDQIAKFKYGELFASDAQLLGRVTYQGFAAAWPSRSDEQGFADRMNNMPKYVVSSTLSTLGWNNSHLITGDYVKALTELKNQSSLNILVAGSAMLVNLLLRHDLLDELRLLIYPVAVGKGKRLFQEGTRAVLDLVETQSMGAVVLMIYQPERN